MVIAILGAGIFFWLALAVVAGVNAPFDVVVRETVHGLASPAITSGMKILTWLGSGWVIYPAGTVIVVGLARRNWRREAALFTVAVLGAAILEHALKLLFHRTRPDPFFGYPAPGTYSFPSGHALLSFTFYFTLVEVLAPMERRPGKRFLCWTAAMLITLVIGLSRIYLGIHYPSDVLAGYAGAVAWTSVVRLAHQSWWAPVRLPGGLERDERPARLRLRSTVDESDRLPRETP
jgi:undecaprenyl-diphosphatase